jgi:hypothetical protein
MLQASSATGDLSPMLPEVPAVLSVSTLSELAPVKPENLISTASPQSSDSLAFIWSFAAASATLPAGMSFTPATSHTQAASPAISLSLDVKSEQKQLAGVPSISSAVFATEQDGVQHLVVPSSASTRSELAVTVPQQGPAHKLNQWTVLLHVKVCFLSL